MNANLGSKDRLLRLILGLIPITLAMVNVIGPWGWVGMVPIVSAALGWCPAYMLAGFTTRGDL
ncbi:MAG: DUF2892 domain-containing protein [Magnetospirillum sp.]|nr:DUF2892 domain-containing protein [Magnetospirillum sp.]